MTMTQRDPYSVKNVLPLRQNNPYSAGTKVFTTYTSTMTMFYYDEDASQPTTDKSNTPTSIRSDEDYRAVPELSSLTSFPIQPQTAADTTKAPQGLQHVRYQYRSDLAELGLHHLPQEFLEEGADWLDIFVLESIREKLASLTQGDELFRNRTGGYSELKIFKWSREKNYRTCYIHKDTHDLRFLVRDDHAEWWVEKFNRTRFSFDTITRNMMIGEEAASATPLELVIQRRKHQSK